MDLFALIPHINTSENAIQFLRDRGILRSEPPNCPTCQREMTEVSQGRRRRSGGDDKIWRCPTHKNKKESIRKGSFLENSNLPPKKFVLFTYLWAHGIASAAQESICDISRHTAIEWNNFLRDICSRQLLAHPIHLGGVGHVVQIDESLMAKRKYEVGHPVPKKWAFGMWDCHRKLGVLVLVDGTPSQANVFPLITQYILPGTMIHSDRAAIYVNNRVIDPITHQPQSHLVNLPVNPPYQHLSVNHTYNFVDPTTGAFTNNVECFWKNAKQKFKAMSGTTVELVPSYLDEFQWRQLYGKKTAEAFDNILAQIAHYYPV